MSDQTTESRPASAGQPEHTCLAQRVGRDEVDRAEGVAGADEGAVGDRVGEKILAVAAAEVGVGRRQHVGPGLAEGARRARQGADRHHVAGVEEGARPHRQTRSRSSPSWTQLRPLAYLSPVPVSEAETGLVSIRYRLSDQEVASAKIGEA